MFDSPFEMLNAGGRFLFLNVIGELLASVFLEAGDPTATVP
jgi:hypothetical protein|tara:strand:- start:715 stop:837 length:123 start_codon:yes stop_codon:yes gene_type:complete